MDIEFGYQDQPAQDIWEYCGSLEFQPDNVEDLMIPDYIPEYTSGQNDCPMQERGATQFSYEGDYDPMLEHETELESDSQFGSGLMAQLDEEVDPEIKNKDQLQEQTGISIWDLLECHSEKEKPREIFADPQTLAAPFVPLPALDSPSPACDLWDHNAVYGSSNKKPRLYDPPPESPPARALATPRAFKFQPTTTQESFKDSLNQKRKYASSDASSRSNYSNGVASFKANSVIYNRGRSISKMSLLELYEVMGLGHDHDTAIEREEQIMCILERHGFCVGEKTWIRDTEEHSRRVILDSVYSETFEKFGYSKRVLEAIIRRGTYARMQSNLRRRRRRRKKACR